MSTTIKDIARMCNVSTTTVSKVINNKCQNISKDTIDRINRVIKEVNYQPSIVARSLTTKRTNTIALMVPDICNPFFPELARGVEDECNNREYSLFLCNTDGSIKKERQYIDLFVNRSVDGIIFSTQNNEEYCEKFKEFLDNKFPFVFFERYVDSLAQVPGVYVDNIYGGYLATKHLLELGHKKIAFISGPMNTTNAKLRYEGYKKALEERHLKIDKRIIRIGDYKTIGGYNETNYLLKNLRNDFSAIFASNDLMALGSYQAMKENGVKVPEDISLVGFDNISFPTALEPKITTVEIPAYDMGVAVAGMIIDIINNKKIEDSKITYEVKLITKQTTTEYKNKAT